MLCDKCLSEPLFCSLDCQICPLVTVRTTPDNPTYKPRHIADRCDKCFSFVIYTYKRDEIIYQDFSINNLHFVVRNNAYYLCKETTKRRVNGKDETSTRTLYLIP
jgi:hypothetical protein